MGGWRTWRWAAAAGAVLVAGPAAAHPHVFIDAKSELVFDGDGKLTAVRQAWRFDEGYSAFASQGLDANADGTLSVEELQPLADINVGSLADFYYFTYLTIGGEDKDFKAPKDYWIQADSDGLLTLYFTLPTDRPYDVRNFPTQLDVYDPTYFASFEFVPDDPVVMAGAPGGCSMEVIRPSEMDPAAAAALAQIGPEQRDLPPELMMFTMDRVNGVKLDCP